MEWGELFLVVIRCFTVYLIHRDLDSEAQDLWRNINVTNRA